MATATEARTHYWSAEITVTTTDAGDIMDAFVALRDHLEKCQVAGYSVKLNDSLGEMVLDL